MDLCTFEEVKNLAPRLRASDWRKIVIDTIFDCLHRSINRVSLDLTHLVNHLFWLAKFRFPLKVSIYQYQTKSKYEQCSKNMAEHCIFILILYIILPANLQVYLLYLLNSGATNHATTMVHSYVAPTVHAFHPTSPLNRFDFLMYLIH